MVKTSRVSLENKNKKSHYTNSRTYLKQAFPSESMAQAAINMWLDLFMHVHTATDWSTIGVYVHCLRLLSCEVCSDVYNDALFIHLTKCIHVGSINVGWWDRGGGGRREVKRTLKKGRSWKRGNRHRCRFVVKLQQETRRVIKRRKTVQYSQDWTQSHRKRLRMNGKGGWMNWID